MPYVKTLGQIEVVFMVLISYFWLGQSIARKDISVDLTFIAAVLVMWQGNTHTNGYECRRACIGESSLHNIAICLKPDSHSHTLELIVSVNVLHKFYGGVK